MKPFNFILFSVNVKLAIPSLSVTFTVYFTLPPSTTFVLFIVATIIGATLSFSSSTFVNVKLAVVTSAVLFPAKSIAAPESIVIFLSPFVP